MAQQLQAGHHLSVAGGGKLAGDGGGNDGIGFVAPVGGALNHADGVGDPGFVLNSAEGALVDAAAAGDALAYINGCLPVRPHGDGVDRAPLFAGALGLDNGAVLAGIQAAAAVDALLMIDLCPVIDDGNGIPGAGVDAAGGQTAPAGVAHRHLGHGALITGDGQHLHHIGVALVAAHGHLHPAVDDGPLLVNAAAQVRLRTGDDLFRNVQQVSGVFNRMVPGHPSHLRQDVHL